MRYLIAVPLFVLALTGCKEEIKTRQMPSAQAVPAAPASAPAQAVPSEAAQPREFRAFFVYTEKNSSLNHFIPSGWMGDYSDIKFQDNAGGSPQSGSTCIKIEYSNKASNGARWAGIYWQYPQNNWGNMQQGYDLTGAKKLTFWARGEKGNEVIQEFKIGGISGEFSDSDTSSIGPVSLTTEWKQHEIDLNGKDLTHIIGGFCWATNIDVNPEGAVFYLDEIQFE